MAKSTSNRGFAVMDESKQREIASKGGKASGAARASESAAKKASSNLSTEGEAQGHANSKRNA